MGAFSGDPKTLWLSEHGADRRMKLLEDFWFVDSASKRWLAPKDAIVNGASIPEPLWSSVGSPYTGDYRRASIVHDVACSDPSVSRESADDMFYEACLTGGCSLLEAKLLYAGVRIGAWASSKPFFTKSYSLVETKPMIPSHHTEPELIVRAKYTILADKLRTAPDNLPAIKEIVNSELENQKTATPEGRHPKSRKLSAD